MFETQITAHTTNDAALLAQCGLLGWIVCTFGRNSITLLRWLWEREGFESSRAGVEKAGHWWRWWLLQRRRSYAMGLGARCIR